MNYSRLKIADVADFPGYIITNRGRVYRRLDSGELIPIASTARKPSGHHTVTLYRSGEKYASGKLKGHIRYVHALVLAAFTGPCPDGMECRHLNGKPWENNEENLAWGTRRQNMRDRNHLGETSRGSERECAVMTERIVAQLRKRANRGEFAIDLASEFGIKPITLRAALVGRTWAHVKEPVVVLSKNRWKRGG